MTEQDRHKSRTQLLQELEALQLQICELMGEQPDKIQAPTPETESHDRYRILIDNIKDVVFSLAGQNCRNRTI